MAGLDEPITSATYLASSGLCIAAIACLSNQSSARTGAFLFLNKINKSINAFVCWVPCMLAVAAS